MSRFARRVTLRRFSWLALVALLAACGGRGSSGKPAAATPTIAASTAPLPAGPAPRHVMTQDELSFFRPNELGLVPILMYHNIVDEPGEWNRSPDQLRGDLEYLYEQGYYLTSMHQYITGTIDIPAGKTPVILTFDDGSISQFRFLVGPDGELKVDPDSAVGILEDMYYRHPDFGRGAVFYILPHIPFGADEDGDDNGQYARRKIEFLLDRGYELGNHTMDHPDLSTLDDEQIKKQIASADDAIHGFAPNYPIESIALPYGMYPHNGDATLLAGFSYQGHAYKHQAALMVGANPAYSPFDTRRDLMFLPRIRADDDNLKQWFGEYLQVNYDLRYVSDGNPDVVTIPNTLHPDLNGQFDPAKVGGKQIVRYDP